MNWCFGFFGVISALLVTTVSADETLSPAEQAAIAAAEEAATVSVKERRIAMCHQVLLSGLDAQKTELIAMLGGRTCAEAIDDEIANQALGSE